MPHNDSTAAKIRVELSAKSAKSKKPSKAERLQGFSPTLPAKKREVPLILDIPDEKLTLPLATPVSPTHPALRNRGPLQPFALLPEEKVTTRQPDLSGEKTSASCPRLCALLREKDLPIRETYSQQEIAIIFGKNVRTVRSWTTEGRLAAYKLGGVRYFAQDVEQFIRASRLRNGRLK